MARSFACNLQLEPKIMAHTAALETSPANHRILERSLGAARFLQGPPLDIDHYKWVRGVLPRLERRVGIKVAQKRNRSAEAVVRLLDHLHEHHGRVCVRCAEIAVSCCVRRAHASRARRGSGAPRSTTRRARLCAAGAAGRRHVRRHRGERRRGVRIVRGEPPAVPRLHRRAPPARDGGRRTRRAPARSRHLLTV